MRYLLSSFTYSASDRIIVSLEVSALQLNRRSKQAPPNSFEDLDTKRSFQDGERRSILNVVHNGLRRNV